MYKKHTDSYRAKLMGLVDGVISNIGDQVVANKLLSELKEQLDCYDYIKKLDCKVGDKVISTCNSQYGHYSKGEIGICTNNQYGEVEVIYNPELRCRSKWTYSSLSGSDGIVLYSEEALARILKEDIAEKEAYRLECAERQARRNAKEDREEKREQTRNKILDILGDVL
jgi:hypothetical protein